MYTLTVVILTLVIAFSLIYSLYRLGIYVVGLHERDEIRGREDVPGEQVLASPPAPTHDWAPPAKSAV
jgi:hypothetical protein